MVKDIFILSTRLNYTLPRAMEVAKFQRHLAR